MEGGGPIDRGRGVIGRPLEEAAQADVTHSPKAKAEWPILVGKDHDAPFVFRPEALLREARRQKGLLSLPIPEICVLDPDGDVVRQLKRTGRGQLHEGWACYHTDLLAFDLNGVGAVGVVGCAVGASFAVLVAKQLFASGCKLLISVTSAGRIVDCGPTPYFVLIDRALRDEGTSYHYLPPSTFSEAPDQTMLDDLERELLSSENIVIHRGAARHHRRRLEPDPTAGAPS